MNNRSAQQSNMYGKLHCMYCITVARLPLWLNTANHLLLLKSSMVQLAESGHDHEVQEVDVVLLLLVVGQVYETRVGDEFVILGNDVFVKCLLPSFVSDNVMVDGWITSEGIEVAQSLRNTGKLCTDSKVQWDQNCGWQGSE